MRRALSTLCRGGVGGGNVGSSVGLWRSGSTSASTSTSTLTGIKVKKSPASGKDYYFRNPVITATKVEDDVTTVMRHDPSLQHPDYFQVHQLFTVKDLFDARVHLGHKIGSMNPRMGDFVFGARFDMTIIDLDRTAYHLRQALNFVAHIAYRKGIILFLTRSPQSMLLVEKTAIECGEYSHCREWDTHILTNSTRKFGGITRLPDTIIMLNTLDTVLAPHGAILDAAKMLIPTVGIVDTNCDPNLITYPIPGNDDTSCAVQLYCKLFKEAILRGKNKRKQVEAAAAQKLENQDPVSQT